ncbi:adhesion G protein-coupled receptor E3-like [Amia ocellicauda]|uniref:adhesion G protein-coupled receptor E3-like n=1 Tax=Amia ocellicauda TaxID=2972642 RepID=UPI003464044F
MTENERPKAGQQILNAAEKLVKYLYNNSKLNEPYYLQTPDIEVNYIATDSTRVLLKVSNSSMDINLEGVAETTDRELSLFSLTRMEYVLDQSFFKEENLSSAEMNSHVVTGMLGQRNYTDLPHPVKFTFQNKMNKTRGKQVICVYWKQDHWTREGCKSSRSNETHTECSCTHLSSFAVIMSTKPMQNNPILNIVEYVLVAVSLFFLGLAIITFICCHSDPRISTTSRLHLSICLFLAHFIFVTVERRSEMKVLCAVIAAVLHYLFLACFTWMSLEAVYLFLKVRNLKVIKPSRHQALRRRYQLLVGYGIPAIIVAVSAGVFPGGYGREDECWLTLERGFYWSALGPICFFITVNTILFIAIVWCIQSSLSELNADLSKIKDTRMMTFKCFVQFVILGCCWVLGFLTETLVFKIMFVIISSQQGMFIFIVYCLLNAEVRRKYRTWLGSNKKMFTLSRSSKDNTVAETDLQSYELQ